jgi:hypothetical protein
MKVRLMLLSLLLITVSCFSQTGILTDGRAPSPVGAERLLAQRHRALRSFGGSNDSEVYVGIADLDVASKRSEGNLSYSYIIHFTLQYDASEDLLKSVTRINGAQLTTTKYDLRRAITAATKSTLLSGMNFMELQIHTQNGNCAIDVSNLAVNGQTITGMYTRANASGSSYWHLLNYNFGSGFTLAGTITLTGTFGSSTEANKVEFTFGTQPVAPLVPLVWGDISVKKNIAGNNELKWTTLQEKKADAFLLQRSENGRQFETIGRRTAKGNATSATSYAFEDAACSKEAFYRIIAIDIDGKAAYSKIVSSKGRTASSVIYNGNNTLIFQSTDNADRDLKVVDAAGRVFIKSSIKETNAKVDVSSLSKGIYFVYIEGSGEVALRFLKQ